MTTVYKFPFYFTKFGVGTFPAVDPLVSVVDKSNNLLVTTQPCTKITNLTGSYYYEYSGADGLVCWAVAHTTDVSMDSQDIAAYSPQVLQAFGPGSIPWTITVKDTGGLPLDGVNIWISTDLGGTNVIYNGFTNALGIVVPMLDPGTYYAWKQHAKYTFSNPEAFTVV